ncbi:MAG: hypothetical protein IT290_08525 [Deltaproteobacteria bacterium]|nr:hypothetical protein [Deltaproteobacteria bacterium]
MKPGAGSRRKHSLRESPARTTFPQGFFALSAASFPDFLWRFDGLYVTFPLIEGVALGVDDTGVDT